ncbi:MAG: hypothetical protein LBF85_05260 [Tannerella sp.]|jgi:hypothetical protein|nr:hypothetical protein [Tannerella sp.]
MKLIKGLAAVAIFCLQIATANISMAQTLPADTIAAYFDEIREATRPWHALWDKDLYGDLLFVNPENREIFANTPDKNGALTKVGTIYKGILPNKINFANTAIEWNGNRWAMIVLPAISADKTQRINLLAHELFHRIQPELGFSDASMAEANNSHLDTKDGRVYLRLELEALKNAVLAQTGESRIEHLTHALLFRKYRNQLFPGTAPAENSLELNEGLAEYTGQTVSGLNRREKAGKHFTGNISLFVQMPTFVRSFAYQTIPVYGYLLADTKKDWNKEITVHTNLAEYFIQSFHIKLPEDLKTAARAIESKYGADEIWAEETAREERNSRLLAEYRAKFVTHPHVDILLEQMNFSFDPRNVTILDSIGTVYPVTRIADKWGVLTAEKGALISPDWKKVTLSAPTEITGQRITGDGWTLELEQGYVLLKEHQNHVLKRR